MTAWKVIMVTMLALTLYILRDLPGLTERLTGPVPTVEKAR